MKNLKAYSFAGAVVAGLLCLAPLVLVTFGAVGLSWLTPYAEYLSIPIILLSIAAFGYDYYRRKRTQNSE